MANNKETRRIRRKSHIKKKVHSLVGRPRLTVYRSNNHIYAQVVDDTTRVTVANASDISVKGKKAPIDRATEVGEALAKLALQKGVTQVVFDRNGYKYHGRVKALAEGARSGGLVF